MLAACVPPSALFFAWAQTEAPHAPADLITRGPAILFTFEYSCAGSGFHCCGSFMNSWPKTIAFAATLVSATLLLAGWCEAVKNHFLAEHPGSNGGYLANFYWQFSWTGIVVACALSLILLISKIKKGPMLFEVVYYFGIWMLVVWVGVALIAMEL